MFGDLPSEVPPDRSIHPVDKVPNFLDARLGFEDIEKLKLTLAALVWIADSASDKWVALLRTNQKRLSW